MSSDSKSQGLLPWLINFVLILVTFLAVMYADSAKTAGYIEGFAEGQKWKREDKFATWRAWQEYGQARSDFYRQLSQDAHYRSVEQSRVEYIYRMESASREGLGWATGVSNAPPAEVYRE